MQDEALEHLQDSTMLHIARRSVTLCFSQLLCATQAHPIFEDMPSTLIFPQHHRGFLISLV